MLWPQVKPFVERVLALDRIGRYEPVDILCSLLAGTTQLWISWNPDEKVVEAATITEIINYPRAKELRIWLVSGRNMRAWVFEMRDLLEEFARAHGCAAMTGAMREGWLRIGGAGWKKTGVTIEKDIR